MAKRQVSEQTRQRMSRAQTTRHLTLKQERFVKAYAKLGNGTKAAKAAGYSDSSDGVVRQQAAENLAKPYIAAAIAQEVARIDQQTDYGPTRVRARLDRLSHVAEEVQQLGVAVRAEELLGRAAGMFVDQTLSLTANISADHLAALIEVAKQRQQEPIDLGKGKLRNA